MRHSQYTANPLNPPYQGDFEDFAPVEIIGKCILIPRVYYKLVSVEQIIPIDPALPFLENRMHQPKSVSHQNRP